MTGSRIVDQPEPPRPEPFGALARETWDCIVIGAGLAGTSAALGLARADFRVLLVDRARFPRNKVCGGCLNQRALGVLDRLQMLDAVKAAGAMENTTLELAVATRRLSLPMPHGLAISRARLDTLMADAVCAAGGTFLQGTRATLGEPDGDARLVTLQRGDEQSTLRARIVLAADGLHGGTLRSAGHAPEVSTDARVGAGILLPPGSVALSPGIIRMAVADGGYVGASVVEGGQIDMAAAFDVAFLRACGGPAEAANRVLAAAGYAPVPHSPDLKWDGTPPLTRRARVLGAERVLALGDAAGYIEPFTGEGMAWALTSGYMVAPLVAEAIAHHDVALVSTWERAYRQHVASRQLVCRGMAGLLRHPNAARLALQFLALQPRMAQPLMRYINAPIAART